MFARCEVVALTQGLVGIICSRFVNYASYKVKGKRRVNAVTTTVAETFNPRGAAPDRDEFDGHRQ